MKTMMFDTGADGNLRMNRKDLENNAPINVDIITAGNGEDGSKAVLGKDVYETFSPVVDYSTVRLLVSFAFANRWKIKHLDIPVAFTNALAIEETHVQWPTNLPPDPILGVLAGGYSSLNRNLYMDQNQLQDYGIKV